MSNPTRIWCQDRLSKKNIFNCIQRSKLGAQDQEQVDTSILTSQNYGGKAERWRSNKTLEYYRSPRNHSGNRKDSWLPVCIRRTKSTFANFMGYLAHYFTILNVEPISLPWAALGTPAKLSSTNSSHPRLALSCSRWAAAILSNIQVWQASTRTNCSSSGCFPISLLD
jgi:hypothetical protein